MVLMTVSMTIFDWMKHNLQTYAGVAGRSEWMLSVSPGLWIQDHIQSVFRFKQQKHFG